MHGCRKEIDGTVGITLRLLFDYYRKKPRKPCPIRLLRFFLKMPKICAIPTKSLRRKTFRLDSLITPTLKAAGSNPVGHTILTKRYRCVWRKARRINRFRAFSGPNFFFQTIDANRCFRASAPIQTGRFPFSGRCIRPAPVFCGPEHDRSGLIFYAWEELYEHQRRRKEPLLVKITNCGRADAGISGKFNNYAIKRGETCWKSLTFDEAEDYNSLRKAIRRWTTKARRSKVSVHSGEVSSPFAARFSHGYLFRNLEKEDAE